MERNGTRHEQETQSAASFIDCFPDLLTPLDTGLLVLFAEALDPCFGGDLITGCFQAVVDADHVALIDVTIFLIKYTWKGMVQDMNKKLKATSLPGRPSPDVAPYDDVAGAGAAFDGIGYARAIESQLGIFG